MVAHPLTADPSQTLYLGNVLRRWRGLVAEQQISLITLQKIRMSSASLFCFAAAAIDVCEKPFHPWSISDCSLINRFRLTFNCS